MLVMSRSSHILLTSVPLKLPRARGSIYAQRSRDNSKAKAIRLRLQNEVMQLQASNAQLDRNLAQIAVPAGVVPVSSPNATPGSSDSISPESDTSTEGQN